MKGLMVFIAPNKAKSPVKSRVKEDFFYDY